MNSRGVMHRLVSLRCFLPQNVSIAASVFGYSLTKIIEKNLSLPPLAPELVATGIFIALQSLSVPANAKVLPAIYLEKAAQAKLVNL